MFADLHLHSSFSDGTDTPNELIELARNNCIKIISISDHDTIAAYNDFDFGGSEIKVIPAIEISTVLEHSYLHILGYYINTDSYELAKYIERVSYEKTENTRINFENAVYQGCFQYRWERVLELHKDQPRISGVHVVKSMENDDFVIEGMRLWDMFHKYFWAESPDFIPTETATAYDAIDIISKANGISIVAHPKSAGNDLIINDLIKYGVQGIEVYHPIHNKIDIEKYLLLAEENCIYVSGGTDWHGKNNGNEVTHFGMCGLEDEKYPILSLH